MTTLGSGYSAGVTGGSCQIYSTTPTKYAFVWEPAGSPELVGLSGFSWWGGFGDEGFPSTGWAQASRDRVFEPTPPSTRLLTSLAVPVHHDNVDTGGRMHDPWTETSIPALDAWLDAA